MARKLKSWLKGLKNYVEDTESPRQFWLWSGISTIASALQRKCWLPFGIETCYPNLYVLIVGPPASRKAAPVSLSKNLLTTIEIPVSKDSSSKRDFTKELAETGKTELYDFNGRRYSQCSITVISKEMSSLLAVNPKEMIEVLTDLYDSHDKWHYGTSGQGDDILFNVCCNGLIATTPTWFSANLPQEAIGGGFTSRFVIVYGDRVYKRVPRPVITSAQEKLYDSLVNDLAHISRLVGEFSWAKESQVIYDKWYGGIDEKLKNVTDERLHPFIGRMHAMVLKTAMCLQVDTCDDLTLSPGTVEQAIAYLEQVLSTASSAFGGHGRSTKGVDTERVMSQLKINKKCSLNELLRMNYRHLNKTELQEVLESIHTMGHVKMMFDTERNQTMITWITRRSEKEEKL